MGGGKNKGSRPFVKKRAKKGNLISKKEKRGQTRVVWSVRGQGIYKNEAVVVVLPANTRTPKKMGWEEGK